MRSIAEREYFPKKLVHLLPMVEKIVETFPDFMEGGKDVRCHEVARAVACIIAPAIPAGATIRIVDGKFGAVDHTWIEIRIDYKTFILDPYAVASLPQVQLHETGWSTKTGRFYNELAERDDVAMHVVEHLVKTAKEDILDLNREFWALDERAGR